MRFKAKFKIFSNLYQYFETGIRAITYDYLVTRRQDGGHKQQ